jgi:hypothetical protein
MAKYRVTVTSEFESDQSVPEIKFSGNDDEMDLFVSSLPDFADSTYGVNTFTIEKVD